MRIVRPHADCDRIDLVGQRDGARYDCHRRIVDHQLLDLEIIAIGHVDRPVSDRIDDQVPACQAMDLRMWESRGRISGEGRALDHAEIT